MDKQTVDRLILYMNSYLLIELFAMSESAALAATR